MLQIVCGFIAHHDVLDVTLSRLLGKKKNIPEEEIIVG